MHCYHFSYLKNVKLDTSSIELGESFAFYQDQLTTGKVVKRSELFAWPYLLPDGVAGSIATTTSKQTKQIHLPSHELIPPYDDLPHITAAACDAAVALNRHRQSKRHRATGNHRADNDDDTDKRWQPQWWCSGHCRCCRVLSLWRLSAHPPTITWSPCLVNRSANRQSLLASTRQRTEPPAGAEATAGAAGPSQQQQQRNPLSLFFLWTNQQRGLLPQHRRLS